MPYNLSIPGQVSEFQLKAIEAVAALVPKNGQVVEVGSLFGSSSWAWAKSVDPSVTVNCIDPWAKNEGVRNMEAKFGVTYGIEQFKKYTADCPNVVARQGYSPADFANWSEPVDLYYEDAVHTNPILEQNLNFWSAKMSKAGIICGDDYRPRFADVRHGAERLAKKYNRELLIVDFFWCLLPDDTSLPGATKVAETLRTLQQQSIVARRKMGRLISFSALKPFTEISQGQGSDILCRLSNEGYDQWPETPDTAMKMSIRVFEKNAGSNPVVEAIHELKATQLAPDMPHEETLSVSTEKLAAGAYELVYDILAGDGTYVLHPNFVSGKGIAFTVNATDTQSTASRPVIEGPLNMDDVVHAYRWILGREPESVEKIDLHLEVSNGNPKELRKRMINSPEFMRQLKQFGVLKDN